MLLKLRKWKVVRNCLAIYGGSFDTWWNTNYITHVQKLKETKKDSSKSNMAQTVYYRPV